MKLVELLICGIFLSCSIGSMAAAKILFLFPLPFMSHYRAFSPVVEELAARGHKVTAYVAPELKQKKPSPNYTEILVHLGPNAPSIEGFDFQEMRKKTMYGYTLELWTFFPGMTESVLQTPELQDLMESQESYDVIIMEASMLQECFLAFAHKFGAPVVNLHPLFMSPLFASLTGTPNPFSYIPDFRQPYTERMSLWERVHNIAIGVFDLVGGYLYYLPSQEGIMRRNFKYNGSETLPSLRELMANVSLHLVDSHPMIYIRPYSPNVVDVAGMNIKLAGKLPQDLQKFMDEATDGVIYFSFGSHINPKLFPENVRQVFVETMKSLKQRVIWKWSAKIEGITPNILQKSWLPQTEVLAHPNCKLFITHGGFNSLMEVMTMGVPVLGLPIFADQYHNVRYYEHMGVGLGASVDSVTVQEFTEKINRILYTSTFKENAKRLSNIFRDLPQTSLERATYWVEYVIRHKGAHYLKPESVNLPLYKYMLLDVIFFCGMFLVLVTFTVFWVVRKIIGVIKFSSKREQEKKTTNKKHD